MKDASGLMAGLEEAAEEKAEPKKSEKKSDKKSDKKKSGKGHFHKTEIEHHKNGSHTVRHIPHPSTDGTPMEDTSYAAPDMDALHSGMEENLGEPAPGEAAAEAGPAPAAAAPMAQA